MSKTFEDLDLSFLDDDPTPPAAPVADFLSDEPTVPVEYTDDDLASILPTQEPLLGDAAEAVLEPVKKKRGRSKTERAAEMQTQLTRQLAEPDPDEAPQREQTKEEFLAKQDVRLKDAPPSPSVSGYAASYPQDGLATIFHGLHLVLSGVEQYLRER